MAWYFSNVRGTLDKLKKWAIKRIFSTENVQANALAGITISLLVKEAILLPVYFSVALLIATALICNTSETGVRWMHEIEIYLRTGDLPEESKQAHKVRIRADHFTLIRDNLYKRSFRGPYFRCLNDTEA